MCERAVEKIGGGGGGMSSLKKGKEWKQRGKGKGRVYGGRENASHSLLHVFFFFFCE